MKTARKFWIALGVLALCSPLGLILPAYFKAREPLGLEGGGAPQDWRQGLPGTVLSAALGGAVVALAMYLIGKILIKKDD